MAPVSTPGDLQRAVRRMRRSRRLFPVAPVTIVAPSRARKR